MKIDYFKQFDDLKMLVKKYDVDDVAIKMFNCNIKQAENVANCASFLKYALYKHITKEEFKKSLVQANFCKNRFCPVCNWRRARKLSKQYFRVIQLIKKDYKRISFVFLTLTLKNFHLYDFEENYKLFTRALKRFFNSLMYNKTILGYIRGIEAPLSKNSKNYINLHCHILLLVTNDYFTKDNYLDVKDYIKIWKRSLRVDYEPIVYIEKVKGKWQKAVLETIKYPLKHIDYLSLDNNDFIFIYNTIKGKRFFGRGGIITKYYNKIYKNDNIDDDLIFTDDEINELWELVAEFDYFFKGGDYILTHKKIF